MDDAAKRISAIAPGSSRVRTAILQVKVKPRARVSLLTPVEGGVWLAQLKSPPVDGKANDELLGLIARHFACSKSAVSIKSGASGRIKLVQVEGDALRMRATRENP